MFRRNELFVLLLVQVAITLVLSAATPNRGIVHPGMQSSPASVGSTPQSAY
jgi:hypothetical protein